MSTDLVKFEFHGDMLDVVPTETRHCVVIRSITDALGLNYNAIQNRIRRTEWARKGSVMMTVPTAGGPQQAFCLDIRKVPMLLATIDASRVRPDIRAKVELYQEEAAEALADRFLGRRGETNERIRSLEGNVIELLRRVADQPNGLLGTNATDLRARMRVVAEVRKALGDPNATLTAVDNETRMIVDYPRTRGQSWENCPSYVGTRAHSYVAAQHDSLHKRAKALGKATRSSRQLHIVGA
jgi:hypothetical protein